MEYLLTSGPCHTVVLDMMKESLPMYMSHFSLPQSLALLEKLSYKSAVFTGMGHGVDYVRCQERVRGEYGLANVSVGYDGLVIYEESAESKI